MGLRVQVAYFAVFSAVAYAVLIGQARAWLGPALREAIAKDPSFSTSTCFSPDFRPRYGLPIALEKMLCTYNGVFSILLLSKPASLLANQFGQSYYVVSAIMAYESFKQPNFMARRGLLFLSLAQIISIGGTLPLYLAFVAASRWQNKRLQGRPVRPEEAWAVLLGVLAGYVWPSNNLATTRWSYDALSIWQIFPIYILAITLVAPFLIRPIVKGTSSSLPVGAIVFVGVALSANAHYRMLASGEDFRDVVMMFSQPRGATTEVHRFFLIDFVLSSLAAASHLIMSFEGNTSEERLGFAFVLFFSSQIVGVGGALSLLWGYREIFENPRIDAWQKRVEARKAK